MNRNDKQEISKLPMRVGDSDQFISGIIPLKRLMELVKITVKDVRSGQEWQIGPVPVPAPVESFCEALNRWRASLTYPATPKIRTRTLEANKLELYCLRYRQAYELMGDGPALEAFRTQLWQEWRQAQTEAGTFPNKRGQKEPRRAIRKNFADALDAYLAEWKANQGREPYGVR